MRREPNIFRNGGKIMKNKLTSISGLTFVELMAVVVIVGLLAGMAVPRFQIAYERMQARTANRELSSSMRLARSMSVSDKDQYGVSVSTARREVTLFKNSDTPDEAEFNPGDSIIRVDSLPAIFTYVAGDTAFVFQPNGSVRYPSHGYLLTMTQSNDVVSYTLHNVIAATGRIKILAQYY